MSNGCREIPRRYRKTGYMEEWPKTAYRYHLCIHNWPDEVDYPRPAFDYKRLGKAQFNMLLEGFISNKEDDVNIHVQPTIERWKTGDVSVFSLLTLSF